MKMFSHLWEYLAEFCLEYERFQVKVLERIKTYISCSVTVFRSRGFYEITWEKHGRGVEATDDYNTTHVRCVLDNEAYRRILWICNTYYFSRQQWFYLIVKFMRTFPVLFLLISVPDKSAPLSTFRDCLFS